MPLFGGVERLEKKREKIRDQIGELRQEIQQARDEGDKDRANKLDSKRKHLMGRLRWYDERIEQKKE